MLYIETESFIIEQLEGTGEYYIKCKISGNEEIFSKLSTKDVMGFCDISETFLESLQFHLIKR